MKNLYCLWILASALVCHQTLAQNVEVIYDEVRTTAYEGKSYFVVKSFTLKPPPGGQFKVTAATNGEFFIRAQQMQPKAVPSPGKNFVREESILQKGVLEENQINALPPSQVNVEFKYIDGMGREIETVNVVGSAAGRDVITANYFDNMGNKTKQYLSYTHDQNNGAFRSGFDAEVKTFYTTPVAMPEEPVRPFVETLYEKSSLAKQTDIYGAGNAWFTAGRRKQMKTWVYAGSTIRKWVFVSDAVAPTISTYDSLLVQEDMDEENHVERVFTNKRGLTVLRQQQSSGDYATNPAGVTWNETYYCYDDLGRLRYVIPPEAASRLATEYITNQTTKQNFLDRWCFKYQYDGLYNQTARWFPGWTDWEYIIYDRWNREVLRQSPAQRARNEWSFIKYDRLNREILTGLWVTTTPVATLRTDALAATVRHETAFNSAVGYTLTTSYPTAISASDVTVIHYYDDYTFLTYSDWDTELSAATYNPEYLTGFPQAADFLTNVKGHTTGTKVRVMGQSRWLNSVTRYDNKFNPQQITTENLVGGYDRITNQYSLVGNLEKKMITHTSSFDAVDVLREFEYNKSSQLLRAYQTTGSGPRILLAENRYNESGNVIEKNIHSTNNGSTFLQSVDYRYDIRGSLTSINNSALSNDGVRNDDTNDIFGMELLYNPATQVSIASGSSTFTPARQYNGNIGAIKWKVKIGQETPVENIYGFEYDVLGRLTKAYYAADNGGQWNRNVGLFDEAIKAYDKNGNIQGIQRFGKVDGMRSLIDSTFYGYQYASTTNPTYYTGASNRLWKIKDSGNPLGFKDGAVPSNHEYLYDAEGNLIFDLNKQISSISYNHLNLPQLIEFTRSGGSVDRIKIIYDGLGTKLRIEVWKEGTANNNGTLVSQTDYVGEIQYDKKLGTTSQLSFMLTPEGRVVKRDGVYGYEYFYRDHLGNVRATYGLSNETISYRATMERPIDRPAETPPGSTLAEKEEQTFLNIASTRFDNATYNYTRSSEEVLNPSRSALTNGFLGKPVGPAKMLTVSAGDKVRMEIFSKYSVVTGNAGVVTSAALIAAVTGTFGITAGETAYGGFQQNVPIVPGSGSASATLPKAYLAYLFFNANDVFVSSSATSITTSAYNAFEKLERSFTAPVAGKLYVYVVNETNTSANASVYFDEMLIVHQKNNAALQVTQASDYYPFGLAYNTFLRENTVENRYLYNQGTGEKKFNTERIFDLGLNVDLSKHRAYDPATGRWNQVDPLADEDELVYLSPYNYSYNNPVRYNDPEGDCPTCLLGFFLGAAVDYGMQVAGNYMNGKTGADAWTDVDYKSILISGAAGAVSQGTSVIGAKLATTAATSGLRKVALKVGEEAVGIGIDATESIAKQINDGGLKSVTWSQTTSDVISEKVGGVLTKRLNDVVDTKLVSRQLDRAKRVSAGDPSSSGRATTAKKLQSEYNTKTNINKGTGASSQQATGDVVQNISNAVRTQEKVEETDDFILEDKQVPQDATRVARPIIILK